MKVEGRKMLIVVARGNKSVRRAGKVQVGTEEGWVPLLMPPQGQFRDREKVTAILGLMRGRGVGDVGCTGSTGSFCRGS